MSTESEQPIEKALRACAQKRRDEAAAGAPFELHPATRRLLQDEVKRKFGNAPSQIQSAGGTWFGSWPRLAWCFGILAVLGILAIVVVPKVGNSPSSKLALAPTDSLSEAFNEPAA